MASKTDAERKRHITGKANRVAAGLTKRVLNAQQAAAILLHRMRGVTVTELARMYNVSRTAILRSLKRIEPRDHPKDPWKSE
jgi:hypothetical protein